MAKENLSKYTFSIILHELFLNALPQNIYAVFLPVNGVGNNMNMTDAKRFCERIGALAVPLHCGLFDEKDMNDFEYDNKVVPEFYKEIKL